MQSVLSRAGAVVAGTVLTMALLPAGAASAATSDDCDPNRSTRLLSGGLFGNTTDRLWVDHPTATRTVVCLQYRSLSLGGLTVVADVASGDPPPAVEADDDPTQCPNVVAAVAQPVALQLAVGLATSSVCLTMGSSTVTLRFTSGSAGAVPVLEIWRDGGADWGWIDVAACPVEWAALVLGGGPATCLTENERVFPGNSTPGVYAPDNVSYNDGSTGAIVRYVGDTESDAPGDRHQLASTCHYHANRVTGGRVLGRTKILQHTEGTNPVTSVRCRVVDAATGLVLYDETRSAASDQVSLEGAFAVNGSVIVCHAGSGTWTDGDTVGAALTCL